MTRRVQFGIILTLAVGLLILLVVWRIPREKKLSLDSSLVAPPTSFLPFASSPLAHPSAPLPDSPLPVPPTAPSPVTTATLEAIRAMRPTAPPSSPAGMRLSYVSPTTWRGWALRILAAAGVLAYIGLRLRKNQ
jgi:hypothetical protein